LFIFVEIVPEINVVPEKQLQHVEAPKPEPVLIEQNPTLSEHKDSEHTIGSAHAHSHDDHDHDNDHDVHMMELQEEEMA
jgi:ABC-type Zn2+ transport system substrate-binding protein/surface adhesin